MDTNNYIQQVLQEYLLTKDYQQLMQNEALQWMEGLKTLLKNASPQAQTLCETQKWNTFIEALKQDLEIPFFTDFQKSIKPQPHRDLLLAAQAVFFPSFQLGWTIIWRSSSLSSNHIVYLQKLPRSEC